MILIAGVSLNDCRVNVLHAQATVTRSSTSAPVTNPPVTNARDLAQLNAAIECLKTLHQPLGAPQAGEWLATYPEQGQTFAEYVNGQATVPTSQRRFLYVRPLGTFTESQRKIVSQTARYLELYFGLPVRLEPEQSLPDLPIDAQRIHPKWGDKQIRSTYLLSKVLQPALPPDAHALIAFTSSDLYPGEEMNFVFGQASLGARVGVWSLYRLGEPDENEQEYKRSLLRTMKIATHETGHMFGISHCTAFKCNLNGSNSIRETDQQPLGACPVCMAKICWASSCNPRERYQKLADFTRDQGVAIEAGQFSQAAAALAALYPQ